MVPDTDTDPGPDPGPKLELADARTNDRTNEGAEQPGRHTVADHDPNTGTLADANTATRGAVRRELVRLGSSQLRRRLRGHLGERAVRAWRLVRRLLRQLPRRLLRDYVRHGGVADAVAEQSWRHAVAEPEPDTDPLAGTHTDATSKLTDTRMLHVVRARWLPGQRRLQRVAVQLRVNVQRHLAHQHSPDDSPVVYGSVHAVELERI